MCACTSSASCTQLLVCSPLTRCGGRPCSSATYDTYTCVHSTVHTQVFLCAAHGHRAPHAARHPGLIIAMCTACLFKPLLRQQLFLCRTHRAHIPCAHEWGYAYGLNVVAAARMPMSQTLIYSRAHQRRCSFDRYMRIGA